MKATTNQRFGFIMGNALVYILMTKTMEMKSFFSQKRCRIGLAYFLSLLT